MASELTPKQQKFVQEYLIDLNATQAAIRAGILLNRCEKANGFYVYLLVDSRSGEIFYVGKGKGKRFTAHEREWRNLRIANAAKSNRIGEIVESGAEVIAFCLCDLLPEADAFALERTLIQLIGISRLTNATSGQVSLDEQNRKHSRLMLSRIKPFREWLLEKPRTSFEQVLYFSVINGYRDIASGRHRNTLFNHSSAGSL